MKYISDISFFNPEEMVFRLFRDHRSNWIHRVKGSFTILLASRDKINIFSDRIGIKKFFYTNKGSKFSISNQLKHLTETNYFYPDRESIAIYMLMHQYIDGLTFIKDIFYSPPAACISLGQNFHMENYWDCEELLHCEKTVKSSIEFIEIFSEIVKSYYICLKPKHVALSLTGGLDSRTILSA